MGDPNADVATLQTWWSGTGTGPTADYGGAIAAMSDLVAASSDPSVRQATFVAPSIFTTALLVEPGIMTAQSYQDVFAIGGPLVSSPRRVMLDDLAWVGQGGFWGDPAPNGIADWILSSNVGGAAILAAIGSDPDPLVRLSAITLLNKLAYPIEWQSEIVLACQRLLAVIPSLPMYQSNAQIDDQQRSVLAASAQSLMGTIGVQQAAIASGKLTGLRTATFADGSSSQVTPAPSKPWWKSWKTYAVGAVGLLGGAFFADHRPARG